jgi:peptidoglycan hydrolase-like protein with peptidoglycan-binding domain
MTQQDNEAQAIRNLQTYLRQLSYHDASITAPPVDGIYDRDTSQAIRDFQRSQSLPQTGIVDQALWELLYANYRRSLAENAPAIKIDLFPPLPRDQTYGTGAVGFLIAAVQFMLWELEAKYGGIELPEITGVYDGKTADAVRFFQAQNALPVNGLVDRATWNEIADQYNLLQTRYQQN